MLTEKEISIIIASANIKCILCASKHEQEIQKYEQNRYILVQTCKRQEKELEAKDKEIAILKKTCDAFDWRIREQDEIVKQALHSQAEDFPKKMADFVFKEIGIVECSESVYEAMIWRAKKFLSGAEKPDLHETNLLNSKDGILHGRDEGRSNFVGIPRSHERGSEKPDRKKKVTK